MQALVYENTKTNLPGWVTTVHEDQSRGYAYEQNGFNIHIYGRGSGLWVLSAGLTASEISNNSTLQNWISNCFGANDIKTSLLNIGAVIEGVWRPGLYFQDQIYQALGTNEYEQKASEQALQILVNKLDELFLYIEPSPNGLQSYSHKTRELLILACTEVENMWTQYMKLSNKSPRGRNYNTTDYVKLCSPLHLNNYEVKLKLCGSVPAIKPFNGWSSRNPTQSLSWYDAYNKTKHDRSAHFAEATLKHCIDSIAANIVMFCIRFSPYPLLSGQGSFSATMNQLFSVNLVNVDPTSFYIPKITIPNDGSYRTNLVCGDSGKFIEPWMIKPLIL